MLTLGSLFDGIGGFPLAFSRHGFTPLWASEIEPFCCRVTAERFPDMLQYGDITKLDGGKMWPVDVITGGSPCQDLSVAGKRAGLSGERSGLFMEQIRIVREMRDATDGTRPRFMVWENVPGALSSNGGEDFRIVLEETCRIGQPGFDVPRCPDGKWHACGAIVGDGWSVAWRILDAQYWGVPQRRRRIFLVADFGGTTAPEILFKREGLRRDIAKGRAKGKGTAAEATGCAGEAIFDGRGNGNGKISPTMTGAHNARISDYTAIVADSRPNQSAAKQVQWASGGGQLLDDTAQALRSGAEHNYQFLAVPDVPSEGGGNKACVMYDHKDLGRRNATFENQSPALRARMGTGGENVPLTVAGTVSSKWAKGTGGPAGDECQNLVNSGYAVRRLTPLECEKLQGFPDGWTDIPGGSDSARYKALGNSVAIPCVEYVAEGIYEALDKCACTWREHLGAAR